jgi:hypothetical protein
MTQYAIFLYAPADDDDQEPNPNARAEHERYSEQMQASGEMLCAIALEDFSIATSLRGDVITDGPFLEAKEVMLGLYMVEAPDLDAALAIARQNPIHHQGGGVEVRPVEGSWIRPTSS